jgi:hypothetical protein
MPGSFIHYDKSNKVNETVFYHPLDTFDNPAMVWLWPK